MSKLCLTDIWSGIKLWPLTGKVNNTYYLLITAPRGWDILGSKWTFVRKVDVLEAWKIIKRREKSEFDKGQILLARRLGESISKTAALVVFSVSSG